MTLADFLEVYNDAYIEVAHVIDHKLDMVMTDNPHESEERVREINEVTNNFKFIAVDCDTVEWQYTDRQIKYIEAGVDNYFNTIFYITLE